MKNLFLILSIFIFAGVSYSQWVAGATVNNIGANPSISAASTTVAWVVGNTSNPIIYRTTNHGTTWTSINTTGLANNEGLYCVWATDANNAFVGNGTGNARVYRTTNGGASWTAQFNANGSNSFFNGIVFSRSTPAFGVANCDPPNGAGGNYYLQYTTNSGTSWTLINPPGNTGLNASQHSPFVIDRNFFGFGTNDQGLVDLTTNGGTTWNSYYVGRSGFVSSVTFTTDKKNGFAAVSTSGLSKTTNGGLNWTNVSVTGIEGAFLPFVYWIPGSNLVYASSSGGGIVRSTNWGSTWTAMTTGGQTDIRHMDFIVSVGRIYGYAITGTGVSLSLVDTASALPVQMAYFNCSISENNVTLKWQTEFEINNSGFDIERSDETNGWTKIGFVQGNGNKSTPTNYSYLDKNIQKGSYNYRLKQVDYNGNFEYYNLNSDVSVQAPESFYLFQNYPNPFNPVTSINFNLSFDSNVKLEVFDIAGKRVANLINGDMKAGFYSRSFDGTNIPSGIYFYRINATYTGGHFSDTKKFILIK